MAETLRPRTEQTDESIRYQPIALFSIVAICVAGGFTLLVAVLTVVGLVTRKPVLEPVLILMAVGGVVLSIAARWQIRKSEGTLAGTGLAKVALWLSVICGCCYLAYYAGNALAIQQQAKEFTQNTWLKTLQDRNIERATLFTVPPQLRAGVSERDVGARFGETVAKLRSVELVRVFERAAGNAEITFDSVNDWKQTSEGYDVTLNYIVQTQEGRFDVAITVVGTEAVDTQGRQWFVRANVPLVRSRRLSPYGRMVAELQTEGEAFLRDWVQNKLPSPNPDVVYLNALPLSQESRNEVHNLYMAQGIIGAGIAVATQPARGLVVAVSFGAAFGKLSLNRQLYLDSYLPRYSRNDKDAFRYEEMATKLIVLDERSQQVPTSIKSDILPRLIHPAALSLPQSVELMEAATQFELRPEEVRVSIPVEVALPAPLGYKARGTISAASSDEKLLAHLRELARTSMLPGSESTPLTPSNTALKDFPHNWRIVQIAVDMARPPERRRQVPADMAKEGQPR